MTLYLFLQIYMFLTQNFQFKTYPFFVPCFSAIKNYPLNNKYVSEINVNWTSLRKTVLIISSLVIMFSMCETV